MTRARNIAGFSTITTTPSPVHVGPIGVLTATRIDGEFSVVDIASRDVTAQGIGVTNLQVSGITTGLNVSGIITAQNGINFNGTSTGLNVSGVGTIATLNVTGNATIDGNANIGGVLTYEDVTNVDSVGIVTARGLSIFGNTTGLNVASGISTFQGITATTATLTGNADVEGALIVGNGVASPLSGFSAHFHSTGTSNRIQITTSNTGVTNSDGAIIMVDSSSNMEILNRENTNIEFFTNNTQRLFIDNSGRLILGTNTARTFGGGVYAHLQLEGTTQQGSQFTVTRNTNDTYAPNISLVKTRGTSNGAVTTVQDNDSLGTIQFRGADGSDVFAVAASITGEVDGSPSDGTDMPGALTFGTTADGAASPTERMRITSAGLFGLGTNSPSHHLHLSKNTNTDERLAVVNSNTGSSARAAVKLQSDSSTLDIYATSAAYSGVTGWGDAAVLSTGSGTSGGLIFNSQASSSAIKFQTQTNERMRITSTGVVVVGYTAATTSGATNNSKFNIVGNISSATGEGQLNLWRTAAPSVDDVLGQINFCGSSTGDPGAVIKGEAELAWDQGGDASDHAGRLTFFTVPDNSSVAAERLRITHEGYLMLRDNGVTQTNTTLSYQYEGAFLTHYTARTTAGGDRYRRMLDIASVGSNPHGSSIRLLTSPDDTNPATTVERVRITHEGRVGINKSTPATMLSIKAERSAVPRFGIDGHYSDSSYTQSTWDDSNGLYTLLGVNHKLDANGNDATPVASLHSASIFLDGRGGTIRFLTKPDSGTSVSEIMRIRDTGCVHIGNSLATAAAGRFQVVEERGGQQANDCNAYFETNANDWNIKTYYNSAGTHYHMAFIEQGSFRGRIQGNDGSDVSYLGGSDYRWKENIVDLSGSEGIEICKKLKPRKFNWIENREETGQINMVDGFIAHEVVEAGVLGAVTGEKDAVNEDGSIDGQMLAYGKMTPVLAAAIKGLIEKVEILESEVAALKGS